MKKIVSLLLVLLLALGCAAFVSADDVTGEWTVTELTSQGMTLNPTMMGLEMKLTLNADSTFTMIAYDETINGTWTMNGNTLILTSNGTDINFTYDGTNIVVEESGASMIFTRSSSVPAAKAPAGDVYAEDITDFDGTWVPSHALYDGLDLDLSMLSQLGIDSASLDSMKFHISGGTVTTEDGDVQQFALIDGLLFAETGNASARIRLLEDGTIAIDSSVLEGLTLIYARADAEAVDEAA